MINKYNDESDFIESYTVKRQKRDNSDYDDDLFYSEDQVKTAWIYPLTTLTGQKISSGLKYIKREDYFNVYDPKKGQKN